MIPNVEQMRDELLLAMNQLISAAARLTEVSTSILIADQEKPGTNIMPLSAAKRRAPVKPAAKAEKIKAEKEEPKAEKDELIHQWMAHHGPAEKPKAEKPAAKVEVSKRLQAQENADEVAITKADVVKVLGPYMSENGQDAVVELLSNFGASKVSEVDPARYSELLAMISGE